MSKMPTPPRATRWRETAATVYDRGRRRPILVAIVPSLILFRVKGDRATHSISYETALAYALRCEANLAKANEKAAQYGR